MTRFLFLTPLLKVGPLHAWAATNPLEIRSIIKPAMINIFSSKQINKEENFIF